MKIIQWVIICVCAWILTACIDIKIAQDVDKVSYFNLQNTIQTKATCKTYKKLALLDIHAIAPYDNTNIYLLDSKNLQISTLETKKWISSPKNMLKNTLILKAQEQCFEVSIPPFGTQKLDKTLKISLLALQIMQTNGTYKAQIQIFYEIFSLKNHQSKSGTLESSISLESLTDSSLTLGFVKVSDEVFTQLLKKL
ncbi:hypothetical protein [Helicobacter japonicus]|uniref:hypothetical protein n=1 Tax=Helicobacter japonicus TaxID=425400 RepID=UPI0023F4336F|nr:hypothetical protein [Helicobacter japonicus]